MKSWAVSFNNMDSIAWYCYESARPHGNILQIEWSILIMRCEKCYRVDEALGSLVTEMAENLIVRVGPVTFSYLFMRCVLSNTTFASALKVRC
jgi:hypothetical protein